MAELSYGVDARHRMCVSCGESFAVPVQGGEVSCPRCATRANLKPRDLTPLAAPEAFEETDAQWAERLPILHRQLQSYNRDNKYSFVEAPEGLEELLGVKDSEPFLVELRARVGRCEERGSSSGPDERAVFWLACRLRSVMSVATEAQRIAAVMHTALDVVTDRGFKHGLFCRLSRLNCNFADYDAAEAWLAQCDPVQRILDLDSDYRIARALASGGRGDWARVLTLVGDDEFAVPHEPASGALLGGLRVAALEGLGRGFEAEEAMKRAIANTPGLARDIFRTMFAVAPVFAGAMEAWKRAEPDEHGLAAAGDGELMVVPGKSPTMALGIGALIQLLFGLAAVGVGFHFLGQYRKEHAYKTTRGTIVNVSSRSAGGSGKKARIHVSVTYRYKVDGQVHDGRQIDSDSTVYSFQSDRSAAQKIAALKGLKSVTVYYDAKKPERAVLERQNAAFHMVPFVVAGMAFVMVVVLLVFLRRKRQAYREKVAAAEAAEAAEEESSAS